MANKVYLNSQDIIEIQVVGAQTNDSVTDMGRQTKLLLEELAAKKKPRLIFDDLTQMGATDTPARHAVAELAETLPYDKVAMLGNGSTMMRYGTNLMLMAIGRGNKIKYFESRDEAFAWLLGKA